MKIKCALFGVGYWGKNLFRVLYGLDALAYVCDPDNNVLDKFRSNPLYSNIKFSNNYMDALKDNSITAVVIATPPQTHFEIAKNGFEFGKHIFVEKPMTTNKEHATILVRLAKERGLKLMVGHTFLFTAEIEKIKAIIDSGDIGDLKYIHASRLNLGKFQKSNVILDLAPHDISIFNFFTGGNAAKVQTNSYGLINDNILDVAFINFKYTTGTICNLHLSWLDPKKVRTTTIVGSKKMIVYDMMSEEKIKIYDAGVSVPEVNSFGEYLISYRHGDIVSPSIDVWEPLHKELNHFIECIKYDIKPLTDGVCGLDVVSTLDAALKSAENGLWEEVQ